MVAREWIRDFAACYPDSLHRDRQRTPEFRKAERAYDQAQKILTAMGTPLSCIRPPMPPVANPDGFTMEERAQAEHWLAAFPQCQSALKDAIAKEQQQALEGATGGGAGNQTGGGVWPGCPAAPPMAPAARARHNLGRLTAELARAQADQHDAYEIITRELRQEQDAVLWRQQYQVSLLGTAGVDARRQALTFSFDARDGKSIERTAYAPKPGFRGGFSIGVDRTQFGVLRDQAYRWGVPGMATVGWGWAHTWFTVGAGGEFRWEKGERKHSALIGRLSLEVATVCSRSGIAASHASFVVEPWVHPVDSTTSILFGFELGAGLGFGCDTTLPHRERQDCATDK
jgi:hypothetical protein